MCAINLSNVVDRAVETIAAIDPENLLDRQWQLITSVMLTVISISLVVGRMQIIADRACSGGIVCSEKTCITQRTYMERSLLTTINLLLLPSVL